MEETGGDAHTARCANVVVTSVATAVSAACNDTGGLSTARFMPGVTSIALG